MGKVAPENVLKHIQWSSGDIISPKSVKLISQLKIRMYK